MSLPLTHCAGSAVSLNGTVLGWGGGAGPQGPSRSHPGPLQLPVPVPTGVTGLAQDCGERQGLRVLRDYEKAASSHLTDVRVGP